MALSITEEDVRDQQLQREIEEAYEAFLRARGEARSTAKSCYLKLLSAFTDRVLDRRPARSNSARELRGGAKPRL